MMNTNDLIVQAGNIARLFFVYLTLSILAVMSSLYEYYLIDQILTYEGDFTAPVTSLTVIQTILSILRGVTSLFIAFYFIRWFYFSYRILCEDKKVYYVNYSPGAIIWSWFIPVLNLFYPYQIMRENFEIWNDLSKKNHKYPSSIVLWWWLFFLIALGADFFGTGILEGINSSDLIKYLGNPWPFFVPGLIEVVAILISIKMMKAFKKTYELTVGA